MKSLALKSSIGKMDFSECLEKRRFIRKNKEKTKEGKRCTICNRSFKPRCSQERFCIGCRKESEIYKYAEWLKIF